MRLSESKAAELVGISRISIQRYRDAKDKNGRKILNPIYEQKDNLKYYYYDDSEIDKIWIIKIFQSLGLKQKQIIDIMSGSEKNKIDKLSNAVDKLEEMILVAKHYIETGINHSKIKKIIYNNNDVDYAVLDETLMMYFKKIDDLERTTDFSVSKKVKINKKFDELINCFEDNIPFYDNAVSKIIENLCYIIAPCKYYSYDIILGFLLALKSDLNKNEDEINIENYLSEAFKYFREHHIREDLENCIDTVFENIANYYLNSDEPDINDVNKELFKYSVYLYAMYNNRDFVFKELEHIGYELTTNKNYQNQFNLTKECCEFIYLSIKMFLLNALNENVEFVEK